MWPTLKNLGEPLKALLLTAVVAVGVFIALESAGVMPMPEPDKLPAKVIHLPDGGAVLEKKIDTGESVPDFAKKAVKEARSELKKETGKAFKHTRSNTLKLSNTATGETVNASVDTLKAEDGTTRVVVSSDNKEWKVEGLDTVIVPDTFKFKDTKAAGIYGTLNGKEYGIFYDQDHGRFRTGVEVGMHNNNPRISFKVGMTF